MSLGPKLQHPGLWEQAYSQGIARAYSEIWGEYGERFATQCLAYLSEEHAIEPQCALDLACGTGSAASVLLANGIRVIGIDRSTHMVAQAKAACSQHVESGLAKFFSGDMREFSLGTSVDLALTCYDTINHLESSYDLNCCFNSVAKALTAGGIFVFDLNTIQGLSDWNGVKVQDRDKFALISRGFFNSAEGRAWKKLSGFYQISDGSYERFDQMIFNTAFPVTEVIAGLKLAGFTEIETREEQNFSQRVSSPESIDRIAIIARKPL